MLVDKNENSGFLKMIYSPPFQAIKIKLVQIVHFKQFMRKSNPTASFVKRNEHFDEHCSSLFGSPVFQDSIYFVLIALYALMPNMFSFEIC